MSVSDLRDRVQRSLLVGRAKTPVQQSGYAILKHPSLLLDQYSCSQFAQDNAESIRNLRNALPFVNPSQYRGISREPVQPFPSGGTFIHERSEPNKEAQLAFREIIGPRGTIQNWRERFDEDLLPTLEMATRISALLATPQQYEVVYLSNETISTDNSLLGFDIGYWGDDHFSVITSHWYAIVR